MSAGLTCFGWQVQARRGSRRPPQGLYKGELYDIIMRHSRCHDGNRLSRQVTIIETRVWRTCRQVLYALDDKSKHGVGQRRGLRDCTSRIVWCHNVSQRVSHRYHIVPTKENNWDMCLEDVSADPTCFEWDKTELGKPRYASLTKGDLNRLNCRLWACARFQGMRD